MSWLDEMLTQEDRLDALGNNKIVITGSTGVVSAGTQASTALQAWADDRILNGTPPAGYGNLYNFAIGRTRVVIGTGVAATDVAAVQAAVTAMAGVGRVYLYGSFTFNAPVDLPSDTWIEMHPSTVITSTMTSGTFVAFIFKAMAIYSGSGLLTSDADGSRQVVCDDATLVAGTRVFIGQTSTKTNYAGQQYTVMSVAGGGPYTLTLDRPVLWPFVTGDKIRAITTAKDRIVINGNGALLRGPADRLIQFLGVYRGFVDNLRLASTAGTNDAMYGIAFDFGCLECEGTRLSTVDCAVGVALEAAERSGYRDVHITRPSSTGIRYFDSYDCWLSDFSARGVDTATAAGLVLQSNALSNVPIGCFNVRVSSGRLELFATGASFARAADSMFLGVESAGCDTNFDIADNSPRCTFDGCVSERAVTAGYLVRAAGARMIGCHSRADARALKLTGSTIDTFDVIGFDATGWTVAGVRQDSDLAATARVNFFGGRVVCGAVDDKIVIDCAGPAHVAFTDTHLGIGTTGGDAPIGVYMRAGANGIVTLRNVTVAQAEAGGIGYFGSAGSELRIEGRTDLAATTPLTVNGSTVYVEQASGATSKAVTTADVTLSLREASVTSLATTGVLTGNRNLIVPTIAGMVWDVLVSNTGAFTTTIKTAGGTGIVVAQGKHARLMCDGTNVVRLTADI